MVRSRIYLEIWIFVVKKGVDHRNDSHLCPILVGDTWSSGLHYRISCPEAQLRYWSFMTFDIKYDLVLQNLHIIALNFHAVTVMYLSGCLHRHKYIVCSCSIVIAYASWGHNFSTCDFENEDSPFLRFYKTWIISQRCWELVS